MANLQEIYEDQEGFRDSVSTIDEQGKRKWVYPKKQTGFYYKWRNIVAYILLAFLLIAPYLRINGLPLLQIDIIGRKFIFFGNIFWPQDFYLFFLSMIIFIVFIALFTAVFGRLFCGWVCPQTIFMEMVYRKIEYWIEGDSQAQKRLNEAPWTREKMFKKTAKHILFFAIAFIVANTFLSYIIGTDALWQIITEPVAMHIGGFLTIIVFSFVFYFVFAFMREQVCTVICPYGRLQGVLLDPNSIVVAYDFERGEPRGKIKKNQLEGEKGDCVDCGLCVRVCPTAIDIRNGTQLECINCTACIDACDSIMDKVGKPKGLIRYDSYNGIKNKTGLIWTKRLSAYSAVLLILLAIVGFSMGSRTKVAATILRTPGMLYQDVDEFTVSNLYNIQVINKTQETYPISLELKDRQGNIKLVGENWELKPADVLKSSFFVELKKEDLSATKNKIEILVKANGEVLDDVKTNFMGPIK